jgi:hypothetical protein
VSKYILPLQKGTEALPESVVQLPAVRWRGLESGSTEADSIMKQYGGAISSFYVQQSQNYSLSTVDQSKAFRWLSQTIGVEYLNQSGKEYVTIHVQQQRPQPKIIERVAEEPEKPEEKKELPTECWYPIIKNGKLFSDSLTKKQTVLTLDPTDDQKYPNLIDLGFELTAFGQKFTQFGLDPNGFIMLGALPVGGYFWEIGEGAIGFGTGPALCPYFSDVHTELDGGSVYVQTGAAIFGYEAKPRKYVVVRWDQVGYYSRSNDANTDARCNFEVVVIQSATTGGQEDCPALIGFSYTNMGWESGEGTSPTPNGFGGVPAFVGFCTGSQQSLGNIPASQTNGISNVVANKQLWFKVDSKTKPPTPVQNFPWIKK